VGAHAATILLAKLKESQNHENYAVVRLYSDYFLDPFYDESAQEHTTSEEEEKEEGKLSVKGWENPPSL